MEREEEGEGFLGEGWKGGSVGAHCGEDEGEGLEEEGEEVGG